MDSSILGLIELLVILAIVFGIGFSQLRSLKRDHRPRDRDDGDPDRSGTIQPPD